MTFPFYTFGHSTRSLAEFAALLSMAKVELVVDVRTVRRSRANPQYSGETLSAELAAFGLAYDALGALGGLRGRSKTVPPDTNDMWENQSFHNYADYALSDEFSAGLKQLIAFGQERRTAVMCSEAVWWRCHRRIIADYLLARRELVFHLMGHDRIEPAHLTAGARIQPDSTVHYPKTASPADQT